MLSTRNLDRLAQAFAADVRNGNSDIIPPTAVVDPDNAEHVECVSDYMADMLHNAFTIDSDAFERIPARLIRRVEDDDDTFDAVHVRLIALLSAPVTPAENA